jgi:hypothetical protein
MDHSPWLRSSVAAELRSLILSDAKLSGFEMSNKSRNRTYPPLRLIRVRDLHLPSTICAHYTLKMSNTNVGSPHNDVVLGKWVQFWAFGQRALLSVPCVMWSYKTMGILKMLVSLSHLRCQNHFNLSVIDSIRKECLIPNLVLLLHSVPVQSRSALSQHWRKFHFDWVSAEPKDHCLASIPYSGEFKPWQHVD